MKMQNIILKLRIVAFLLFVIPVISLIGSLTFHNFLVGFNYTPGLNLDTYFKNYSPGENLKFLCDEKNDYCRLQGAELEGFERLEECSKYKIKYTWVKENGQIFTKPNSGLSVFDDIKFFDENVYIKYEVTNTLNENCILNSTIFYKYFPSLGEKIYNLKKTKIELGTGTKVNPFFYGETSISNIVKRFPVNFFFKPLIFLSVLIMIMYWIYYNRTLKTISNSSKNYYFLLFGILSSIFLFLHTFFLGWEFENEFFKKLRRTYVVFFIFFEVLAQSFLIQKIYKFKNIINSYVYIPVIYLKLFFVFTICLITLIILIILSIYDLSSKVDYILEWNYFLILLIFYFLSFLMWKRTNE